jgi:hypothetical protein
VPAVRIGLGLAHGLRQLGSQNPGAAANPAPGSSTKLRRCVLADVLARAVNKVRLSGIRRIPTTRTEQCQSLTAHLTTPDSRRSMCATRGLLLRPSTVQCLPVAPAAQVEPARVGPLAPPCPTDLSLRDRHPALDDPARPSLPASRTPVNRSVRLRRRALRPHIPDEGACPPRARNQGRRGQQRSPTSLTRPYPQVRIRAHQLLDRRPTFQTGHAAFDSRPRLPPLKSSSEA